MFCELQFAYISSPNKSTGLLPFEFDLGRIPDSNRSHELTTGSIQCQAAATDADTRRVFRELACDNPSNPTTAQAFYDGHFNMAFKQTIWICLRLIELAFHLVQIYRKMPAKSYGSFQNLRKVKNSNVSNRTTTVYEKRT